MALFEIHHYHHEAPDILLQQRLDWLYSQAERVHSSLERILQTQDKFMATLDEVLTAVNDESTQEDSIVTLLTQLREQVAGLTSGSLPADVQAKVDAVFTQLTANKAKLVTAIGNTGTVPPKPAPAPTPVSPAPSASPATASSTATP